MTKRKQGAEKNVLSTITEEYRGKENG